jgi:hypothetical protein
MKNQMFMIKESLITPSFISSSKKEVIIYFMQTPHNGKIFQKLDYEDLNTRVIITKKNIQR